MKHERLRILIKTLSYREGDFLLASGKRSKFYIDMKGTTLHPEGANLIGELGAELIDRSGIRCEGVGGLTLGADPIATAISMSAFKSGSFWPAFIVRKGAKGHGTSKVIEGTQNLRTGASLVVVEDVVTTGGSSLIAIDRLMEHGFHVSSVLTVVDREEGGAAKFNALGIRMLSLFKLSEIQS